MANQQQRSILTLNSLSNETIDSILSSANYGLIGRPLAGKTILSWFMEPSTRTETSFILAARALGADVVQTNTAHLSTVKGESFADTAEVFEALGVDMFVVRGAAGAATSLACATSLPVINAGNDVDHPSQGLIDLFTVRQAVGDNITGLHVGIIGDVAHSRVAYTDAHLFSRFGAEVTLVYPESTELAYFESAIAHRHELNTHLLGSFDVVVALRPQIERVAAKTVGKLLQSLQSFALTSSNLQNLKPACLLLHPGPVTWGKELPVGMDFSGSKIMQQVRNAVPVRKAMLRYMGGDFN